MRIIFAILFAINLAHNRHQNFGVSEWALLMSPKGRNASRDGLVKLVVAVCLLKFARYFVTYYVLGL